MHEEPNESKPASHGFVEKSFLLIYNSIENLKKLVSNKYAFAGLVLTIILINIYLRIGMLKFPGLFEPDGFFYYALIRTTINNNWSVPRYLYLSGFPAHNFIGEAPGLPYLTVGTYFFLRFFGVSYYTIMRLLPVVFGIAYSVLAYYLVRHLHNSRSLGLLAMFFVAISSGNVARTGALIYRGDSFISLFLMVSLLLMLKVLNTTDKKSKYIYALAAAFFLSLGPVIWTGSPILKGVYIFALFLLFIYSYITWRKQLLQDVLILLLALLLAYFLEHVYFYFDIARGGLVLDGIEFFVFFIPIILGVLISIWAHNKNLAIFGTLRQRLIILAGLGILSIILVPVLFGSHITRIYNVIPSSTLPEGTNSIVTALVQTTQELQRPDANFLFASFGSQLYLAPIGVLLFLFLSNKLENKEHIKIKGLTVNITPSFLVLLSYGIIVAILQYNAIRFNAITSIPVAIFGAYGLYAIGKLVEGKKLDDRLLIGIPALVLDVIIVYTIVYKLAILTTAGIIMVAASAIFITAIFVAVFFYNLYAVAKRKLQLHYVYLGFVAALLIFSFYTSALASYNSQQADGINPLFLNAMSWLGSNSPQNATVLALWPDGSVIEAWANRTSLMDSVGGEKFQRIYNFSKFLFNTSGDYEYLNSVNRPQYLVARNFWYAELAGIAAEGLVTNQTEYGYTVLTSLNITHNDTAQFYTFYQNSPPYYKARLVRRPLPDGSSAFGVFIGRADVPTFAPIRAAMLYNTSSYDYTLLNFSATNQLNFTLLVSYSGSRISGGALLGPRLTNSNLFKFTFLCNYQRCPYGNDTVNMTTVFINNDTRIIKINYR